MRNIKKNYFVKNLITPPNLLEPSPQPLNTGASNTAPVPATICGVSFNSAIIHS